MNNSFIRRLALLFFPLFSLCLAPAAFAEVDELFKQYLQGNYQLVGKAIDSDASYTGKMSIYEQGGELKVRREIEGLSIQGTAAIEPVLNGDAKVLRIRFQQRERDIEASCLWRGDLDNYARISCYLYHPGEDTENPGLEALFHLR
ncbi:hypothetical protein [Shewanella algae]|uniref:hypothetical protein n=1 Tax=Shewanella algae TaxID=38313 RepID=UPI001AAFF3FA|nr:hypothetical protein [Shewanella algae]MBO2627976.1 hypothetical protein [Shewanella algae]BCV48674.1 hypothetical protein TUM17382_13670 [Shewanella algae]